MKRLACFLLLLGVLILAVACSSSDTTVPPGSDIKESNTDVSSSMDPADSSLTTESSTGDTKPEDPPVSHETADTGSDTENPDTSTVDPATTTVDPATTTEAHSHTYVRKEIHPATCTQAGEEIWVCDCGDEQVKTLSATGHRFGSWTLQKDATLFEDGQEIRTCSQCQTTESRAVVSKDISQKGTWESFLWVVDKKGTLTVQGQGVMPDAVVESAYESENSYAPWKQYASEIKEAVLDDRITHIGKGNFWGMFSLEKVTFPKNLKSIGDRAFESCPLSSVELKQPLETIGVNAFLSCRRLTSFTFEYLPNSISSGCFAGTGFTFLDLPENITHLGEGAFNGCKSLLHVVLPKSIVSVGERCFSNCEILETVRFSPESKMTSLAGGVFSWSKRLFYVELPTAVTALGDGAFAACNSMVELVASGVTDPQAAAKAGMQCGHFACAGVQSQFVVTSDGWLLLDGEEGCLIYGKSGSVGKQLVLPDSFSYRGKEVTSYGVGRLSLPTVEEIRLSARVTGVLSDAFKGATALKQLVFAGGQQAYDALSLKLPTGVKAVRTDGREFLRLLATGTCSDGRLTYRIYQGALYLSGEGKVDEEFLKQYRDSMGKMTVNGVPFSIDTVYVSREVQGFGMYALKYASFKTLCYEGSKEEWNAISKGYSWNSSASSQAVYQMNCDLSLFD